MLLLAAPVLSGVFMGAPLVARELSTGTFQFAWTQGTRRTTWMIAKLILLGTAVTASAAAVSLMFSWWLAPFWALGASLMSPDVFPLTGVAFPAWTLAAFAVGVLAGVLVRRSVPAMAAAIAAWTGLAIVAARLRWHYQSAVILSNPRAGAGAPPRAWVQEYWTGPGGKLLQPSTFDTAVAQLSVKRPGPGGQLARRGFTDWVTYQPESRFWHFQLIEAGWLLALALLLGVATIWLIRRRAA